MARRRAIFLDRDGTLNKMCRDEQGQFDSPMRPDELELFPGVAPAIRSLNELGLLVIVVSNQPAAAKGKTTVGAIEATMQLLASQVAEMGGRIDRIYYCLHHPEATDTQFRVMCECRKPKPGMLMQAARDLGVDLSSSFLIGDSQRDVEAAHAAGSMAIRIGTGPGAFDDLPSAVAEVVIRMSTLSNRGRSLR